MDDSLIAICTAVVVLVVSIIFYLKCIRDKSKGPTGAEAGARHKRSVKWSEGTKVIVLFIDAPDPDNPASAAAIIKHVISQSDSRIEPHLHIVLTGRQVDLRTSKLELYKQGNSIIRQVWEKNLPEHAQKVLEDAAARLQYYLTKCDVKLSMITFYYGGIAPCAPISDRAHDWDFLFDRKDLITETKEDQGGILKPNEYQRLVEEYCGLAESERVDKLLGLLRPYSFTSIVSLRNLLEKGTCSEVILFLGGPATPLVQLFGGNAGARIRPKVSGLYGMFGALSPGRKTSLPNQFNAACDMEAANDLFVSNLFPDAEKYLITTETAKNGALMISAANLEENGVAPYFVELQKLWESTHKGTTQPMFDVLPVMAFMTQYRGCFKWSRKKAILEEVLRKGKDKVQMFSFADSEDETHILVSEADVDNLTREDFVKFLQKTWA